MHGRALSIAVAAKLSGKAPNTIRSWAERYGIGRKIGGDWQSGADYRDADRVADETYFLRAARLLHASKRRTVRKGRR
jgi:hypothetical protein